MKLAEHPIVKAFHADPQVYRVDRSVLSSEQIKQIALDAGADDIGVIEISREAVQPYRDDLLTVMRDTRSLMIVAYQLNQTPLQSLVHSVADLEFQRGWDQFKNVENKIVNQLSKIGVRSVGMPTGFPMEMKRWPDPIWLTNEKLFATEAGLGQMGINRLMIHPKFGASVILGTILLANTCDQYDHPIEYNPCINCGLCVQVCPTGAIQRKDGFNFTSCYTHNYRERIGGFLNWIEHIVESKTIAAYRNKVSDGESFSMWQNLSIGSQTRCDRCMAVCPVGETALGRYLEAPKQYKAEIQKPFNQIPEEIYVVKGSDAEKHVVEKLPQKTARTVSNGIRPLTVEMFLSALPRMFQRSASVDLNAVYHFQFTGKENTAATVIIKNQTITVENELKGDCDLKIMADSQTWIRFLAKEVGLLKALFTRKLKIKGSPKLMMAFAKCFPA